MLHGSVVLGMISGVMEPDETQLARRARTATRIGIGAVLAGMQKAGEIIDEVGARPLPALPPGDPADDAPSGPTGAGDSPEPTATSAETRKGSAHRPPSDRQALVVGTILAAEEQAVGAIQGAARIGRAAGGAADRTFRFVAPHGVIDGIDQRIAELRRNGRESVPESREQAKKALSDVTDDIVDSQFLVGVIEEAVGRVIDPVMDLVMPIVIERLNENPEPIQQLVASQSIGMASEMTDTMRSGALTFDSAVENIARRLTLRRRRTELGGPPHDGTPTAPDELDGSDQ